MTRSILSISAFIAILAVVCSSMFEASAVAAPAGAPFYAHTSQEPPTAEAGGGGGGGQGPTLSQPAPFYGGPTFGDPFVNDPFSGGPVPPQVKQRYVRHRDSYFGTGAFRVYSFDSWLKIRGERSPRDRAMYVWLFHHDRARLGYGTSPRGTSG